jgi:ABC-type branched-subunit amino acid transport system substrate-binding protein
VSSRLLIAPLLLLLALSAMAAELTPEEKRGKQIYTQGTSASGVEIKAALGEEGVGTEVPASALPCAGCHGLDGHGGKEGGVRPPDLTREALGRRQPPYDDHRLIRAITMGINAAGGRLHVAMPRYRLTRQDAADLLAYLKRLGHEEEPGLTPKAVHVGVLLPGGPRQASQAAAVRAALAARCAELNRGGGLYGRELALHFVELPDSPAERAAKLKQFLAGEPVFALVGVALRAEDAGAAEAAGVPLVSSLTSPPQEDAPPARHVFYLTPGLPEQAAALVGFAAGRLPDRGGLALVRSGGEMAAVAEAAAAAAREQGFTVVQAPAGEEPAALARRLAGAKVAALLLLDGGSVARELLGRAGELGWRPLVLLPGALAAPGEDPFAFVPASLGDRTFISLPLLPPDQAAAAAAGYRRLAASSSLPAGHVSAQTAALAAVEVLVEGLRRTGREVSREKLVATLETLYRFDAGLGAPVSFGPNRRLGARGAFVSAVDLAHHTLEGQISWVDLGP